MALLSGGGKLSGKNTAIALRRRETTRRSGFGVKEGNTGGTYQTDTATICYELTPHSPIEITFEVPQGVDVFSGFGMWFAIDHDEPSDIKITQTSGNITQLVKKIFERPNWSKLGSMWIGNSEDSTSLTFKVTSKIETTFYLYEALSGTVSETELDIAPAALKKNMYMFSPEALFIAQPGTVKILGKEAQGKKQITLKNCNRCGRYLPINTGNERQHLSFTNHCTAPHKVPCSDSTFSKLKRPGEKTPSLILRNGFQLECRFCKKFYVNAALNPQRTVGQMREDGQRRRAFELLINKALGKSPLLEYKQNHPGRELADDIWQKFDKKCFKCKKPLKLNEINLDHTRPLALLWPLDETATSLCRDCNGDKRDRSPSEFYTTKELEELSKATGLELSELQAPHPNLDVLDLLWNRKAWIFDTFFQDPAFAKIRQGKDTRNLIVKALDKTSQRAPERHRYNFSGAYADFLKNKN